jgi:hypothetical protein
MDEAEDRRIRADAERKREHSNRGERGLLGQTAQCKPNVPADYFHDYRSIHRLRRFISA